MWKVDLRPRLFVSLLLGVFMGALDLTILAPALPHMSADLGVTPSALVLAFSLYAVSYAVAVPVMSKLGDVRGYRPVYLASMLLFAGGSAVAALAPTLPVLILGRTIQGVGGGGLFPVAQAIVGELLEPKQRGRALGILLGAFALGGVLGPNLGGFLVQHFDWQWIFWINVPLGLLGALLLAGVEIDCARRRHRLDWVGAALVAVTFGSLVLGIERLRDVGDAGFFSPAIGGLLLLGLAGLAVLVPVELRTPEPILDFRLITSAALWPLLLISGLVGFALLSGVLFLPLFMQLQFGASAFGSGAVLNAAALGLGASSWVAGALTARAGAGRLVRIGMGLTTAGLVAMIALRHELWGLLGGLVLLGAGLGLAQGPLSYLGLTLAPEKDRGQISGLISITRSIGGAVGVSLAGVVLGSASRLIRHQAAAAGVPELHAQVWGGAEGLRALARLPADVQAMVRATLGAGIVEGWYWAAGAALAGLVVALLSVRPREPQPPDPAPRRAG